MTTIPAHLRGADNTELHSLLDDYYHLPPPPRFLESYSAYESRHLVASLSSCVTRHAALHAGNHVSFPVGLVLATFCRGGALRSYQAYSNINLYPEASPAA